MSDAIPAPIVRPPLQGGPLVMLTAGVALATFMEVLDISIVNVSVRNIAGDLAVSHTEGTMAISAYSVASAIVQPLTGWISRRFGEVKTFSWSVLLFVLFSALCGFSTSMNMLIVARLLQGLVSGPMVPLSQSILLSNYPPNKRPIALALWAMMVSVAPVFGPILGGWITDNYQWAWIFFINVPIGIFTLAVVLVVLRNRETRTARIPLDAIGLFLLAVGVGCLQFMLDKGNDYDWFSSKLIIVLSLIALVCLTFLVAWELMHEHPVVNLRLLARRNYGIGVACLSAGMFAFFGGTVVLPTWLQQAMGYNATWAGFAVAPIGLFAVIMSPIVGSQQHRFDLRILNCLGFALFASCSFWMSHQNTSISYAAVALPRLIMGLGIAMFFIPVNQIILTGIADQEIASASGLSNFMRTLASSVATAVSTTLYEHRTTFHHATLVQHVMDGDKATQNYYGVLSQFGLHGQPADAALDLVINQQAQTLASNDVFWLFGIMFGLAMITIWFAKPPFGYGRRGGH